MARRLLRLLLLWALAVPAATHASQPVDGLAWLVGSWKGGGTHSGAPSQANLEVGPALGGKFVQLHYRLEVAGPRPFSFEGRAFYRPAEGKAWKADWFDSRGLALPVNASLDGTSLTADWGAAGTEQGRTLYRLMPDGRLEIVDWVLGKDGGRREFARQTFSKVVPPPPTAQ